MTATCTLPPCRAEIPTRTRYVPLTGDRYAEQTVVDLDAWRAHLLNDHPVRMPTRLQVAS